jgi:uncharacterized repeat protein (TIGR01451 family)
MNKLLKISRGCIALLLFLVTLKSQAQTSASCNLNIGGINYPVTASVPISSLTGQDFNLSITLPGLPAASNCASNYTVGITTSNNMNYVTGVPIIFGGTPTTYTNITPIATNSGLNLLVVFKFKPGVTCDGESGKFDITIKTTCGGVPVTCNLVVKTTAVAQNYWVVKKTHVWGNLKGGSMIWKIRLEQLPHTLGIGDYDIARGKIRDNINCDKVTSVTGVSGTITGIGTATANWTTGYITSTTPYVEYFVTTVCCNPNTTVATNCVDYRFDLGKTHPFINLACQVLAGQVCASKPMVTAAGCVAPFFKSLTYPVNTQVNYAQGCEGEYTMCVSNGGNLPLTNLNISDVFPSGIDITNISVYSAGGVNMPYTLTIPGTTYTGNVNTYQSFPSTGGVFSTAPTSMTFQTTSGSLTYGSICIKIRFKITAVAGTPIKNCAILTYSGSNNVPTTICNIQYPPCPNGNVQSCADFTVEQPKAIPGISKCINGGQSYLIGASIPFCITISNHGSGNMTSVLNDALNSGGQNLEYDPSVPVQYGWGSGYYNGYTPCCPLSTTGGVLPSWATENLTNLQNPTWTITNMPGDCRFNYASYLVIKFNAKVKPQNYGQYTNTATLTTSGTTLNASALYNILRIAQINTTKLVNNGIGQAFASSGFVNPGSAFQYLLRVENLGSVGLKNISVKDAFPSCVQFTCPTAPITCNIYNAAGTITGTTTATCATVAGTTTFTCPALMTLAPGSYVDIIVNVVRVGSPDPCCNLQATGYGTAADTGSQTIQDSDGPVCVIKSMCCDLDKIDILPSTLSPPTWGNYWNFGLTIIAGNLPIQEVDISVMDYHFTYQNSACKPPSVGNNLGHLVTTTPVIGGGLTLTPPMTVTNNLLNWQAGTPVLFTGAGQLFKLHIMRPLILPLDCCKGSFYYCVKVRLKDVKCRICEKIVCFNVPMGTLNFPIQIQEKLDISEKDFPTGN